MILSLLRIIALCYLAGLFILLFWKLSHVSKTSSGLTTLFLFPLLIWTKQGRATLLKEIKK